MSSLVLILALSAIIWYVIDRFKEIWDVLPFGKYITTLVAGILGAAVTFGYDLDLIHAAGLCPEMSIIGQIITILAFMCGSSAINEILARIKQD